MKKVSRRERRAKKMKNQKIKTVVLDTCEDRNAYGNNFQWCIAANGLDKGINTNNATSEVGQDWAKNLRFGTFTTDNDSGVSTWNYPSDCIDSEGNWICTNLANAPLHFDFGIQNFLGEKQKDGTFPPDVQKALNNINPNIDWNTWNNPVVTARPIECDNEVLSTLLKTMTEANKDLVELQKKKTELQTSSSPQTINNNLFVGSTAELQKILKGEKDV